jgi:carbonic anhydrase
MVKDYSAHLPWSPDRPETLIVCCSDGRWHAHLEEFVHHEVSERADMFAVPGGPACIDPWNSTFDEARVFDAAMRVFVSFHDIKAVWLIAHEGCAYYRGKHPHIDDRTMRLRQEEDMQRARQLLLERHPNLAVLRVYASLNGREVVFTTLD